MEGILEDKTEKPRAFGNKEEIMPEVDEDGLEQATDEEQQDYDFIVVRAQKMMFDKARDNILSMMGSSDSPSKGMGQAAAMIVQSLVQSAKEQGRELSPDAVMSAGAEVIDDLSELGKKNGVFEYDSPEDENAEIADAMLWAVKIYGDGMQANGDITPEMQQMAQLQVKEGMESEGIAPQQNQVAAGVNQAVNQPQKAAGLINNAMQGGV